MAFSNAGGGPSRPQMNVTPLIDVLLVLIIVFMVVVSMDKSTGLATQVPQPPKNPNEAPRPERTIVIQVMWTQEDQTPALKINDENVKCADLHERLQGIFAGRVERVAFVRGDDDIDFEDVERVIDIAKRSGVDRVGLLTKDREVATE